jgi:hypothetical protein
MHRAAERVFAGDSMDVEVQKIDPNHCEGKSVSVVNLTFRFAPPRSPRSMSVPCNHQSLARPSVATQSPVTFLTLRVSGSWGRGKCRVDWDDIDPCAIALLHIACASRVAPNPNLSPLLIRYSSLYNTAPVVLKDVTLQLEVPLPCSVPLPRPRSLHDAPHS